MAEPDYEFMDGFDKYGIIGTDFGIALIDDNEWSSTGGTLNIAAALVGNGTCLAAGSTGPSVSKTLPSNYARCIGGVTLKVAFASFSTTISLNDGGTNQMQVIVNSTGALSVARNGTSLASQTGVFADGETKCVEWDIMIADSGGWAKVWIDSLLVLNFSGDTKNTANAYYNALSINLGQSRSVDHFYSWHYISNVDAGETPCLTNPVIETQQVSAESSCASTWGANFFQYRDGPSSRNQVVNALHLRKIVTNDSGNLDGVYFWKNGANGTAKYIPALYSDSSGSPNALLKTGSEVTGAASGTNYLPFASSQAVTPGTTYWIGFLTNTADTGGIYSGGNDSNEGWLRSGLTYASGAPNPVGGGSAVQSFLIMGKLSGGSDRADTLNHDIVSDLAYNLLTAANVEDLYTFPALSVNPSQIYSVAVKNYMKRADAGVRTVDVRLKSSSTTSSGSGGTQAPTTGGGWISSNYRKDPNGNIDWVKAALDAATAGYKSIT